MRPHTLCSFLLVLGLASSFALLPAGSARAEPAIAAGRPLLVQTALSHPNLPAAPHTSYLKVGLVAGDARQERPLANVALVLDRSGSMMGEKLQRAKEAAKLAVERLRPDDVVAVVTYSDTVSVLVPATRAVAREAILEAIDSIGASGSTALFAGVSKGAEEVRRFYHPHRVNRIVLLSDGLANVGPSSPAALGSLGESLGREGIGVTTIGLGLDYNEDLMTQLAGRSEGNHFFAQTPEDLQRGFDLEFSIGLAVAMRDVRVAIRCAEGVRPVRLLSGTGDIVGQQVAVRLNQLYAGKEAVVLLELQTAFPEPRPAYPVASLVVTGSDLRSRSVARLEQQVQARTVADPREAERSVDPTLGRASIRSGVMAGVVGMIIVMIFMMVYYRFAGVVANIALVLDVVIMLGALGFSVISFLNGTERVPINLSPIFIACFTFCFAITLDVIWEVYEFTADSLFATNMQKYALESGELLAGRAAVMDTMKDLVIDCIGAFLLSAFGFIMAKYKQSWIEKIQVKKMKAS